MGSKASVPGEALCPTAPYASCAARAAVWVLHTRCFDTGTAKGDAWKVHVWLKRCLEHRRLHAKL